jgi:hypothetical protein
MLHWHACMWEDINIGHMAVILWAMILFPTFIWMCVSYPISNLYMNVRVCPTLFPTSIWMCVCVRARARVCTLPYLYMCVCLVLFPTFTKTWNKTCCPISSLPKTCYPIFNLPKTCCVLPCFQNCCLLILLLQWSQLVSTCCDPQKIKN